MDESYVLLLREEAFDDFIRKWVDPSMQGHLLDNDNNDGERVRRLIRAEIVKARANADGRWDTWGGDGVGA